MIDFRQTLKGIDGNDMTEVAAGPDGRPQSVKVTLWRVCVNALLGGPANEKAATGEEHLKRYLLAEKIKDAEVALAAEDITLIKTRVAQVFTHSLVVGQVIKMLDPAAVGGVLLNNTRDKKKAA